MSHHALKTGYEHLVDRLNKAPQGAPPSDLLYRILECLFSEREAELVSVLPMRPFSAAKAARRWQMPLSEAQSILDRLADRGVLVDLPDGEGQMTYVLPPPMAGFFEFSMMRVRGDVDQKLLAELFYQYITVEEDFIKALFLDGETQLGRVFVSEAAVPSEHATRVLDYERASEVIRTASHIGIGLCYCRHKMTHLDRACDAPLDICMTFNAVADSLVRHGIARGVDAAECRDLLDQACAHDLVQFGDNVQRQVSFICNCCGCCCEAMLAARRFGHLHPVHTTNFIAEAEPTRCTGCGRCLARCPVEALTRVATEGVNCQAAGGVHVDEERCLGCGVCARACTEGGLHLRPRAERVLTPVDSVHKTVLMALERGKLQNLLLDSQAADSHRALAAFFGAILRLPPVKRALARRQLGSRYLEALSARREAPSRERQTPARQDPGIRG